MRYFLATWSEAPADEPIWMALEVDADGAVPRLIEHYEMGWTGTRSAGAEESDSLLDDPFDPEAAAADPTLSLREIPEESFAALWEAQEAPGED